MTMHVICDRMIGAQRSGQNKSELMLPYGITGTVFNACLGAGIGQRLKAKGTHVVMGSLLGITHVELDIVSAFERKKIFH
jgi:hypothetical protein